MANSNLVLRLLVLGVVAVIIWPDQVYTQKCRKGGLCEKPSSIDDDIWMVHFTGGPSRWNYWDPITGQLNGYYIDLLNAVCRIAEKNCVPVHDVSSNCWTSDDGVEVGGLGLFNFYYDACIGWNPTYTRLRTFQFSSAVRQNAASGFIVKPGNPDGFDYTNLAGQKLGFIDGFFSNTECLARNSDIYQGGDDIADENIFLYPDLDGLVEAVLNDEVDAGFDREALHENNDVVDYIADSNVLCSPDGPALMMRKDNLLKSWFDPAWEELIASPEYAQICSYIDTVHSEVPGPDSADVCVTPP